MYKTDYLILSISAFSEINRKVYYELAEKGNKIVITFPHQLNFNGVMKDYEPCLNNQITAIPLKYSFSNPRITYYPQLKEIIKKFKPRFLYTDYDPASLAGVMLARIGKRYGGKLISLSCENLSLSPFEVFKREGVKGIPAALMKNLFIKLIKNKIYYVLTLSNDGKQIFESMGFKNVSVSHLGFDEFLFVPNDKLRNEIRNKLELKAPAIAYFGRLIKEKGVHILIEALAKIKHKEWVLIIDEFSRYKSPYQLELITLIKKYELEQRIVFFDAAHDEMPAYMNAADIVVVPSISSPKWKEQFGRVAPEAMACGRTVIVSDSGTLKELVPKGTEFVFPEKNAGALAERLTFLLDNADVANAMAKRGYERAHELFTIKKQAASILAIQ